MSRNEEPIDPRTGRAIGDHGTALQAIQYATESYDAMSQEREFLKAWLEGSLDEWPEYYEWLAKVAPKAKCGPNPSECAAMRCCGANPCDFAP